MNKTSALLSIESKQNPLYKAFKLKEMYVMQRFYDLVRINIITSNFAGQIRNDKKHRTIFCIEMQRTSWLCKVSEGLN